MHKGLTRLFTIGDIIKHKRSESLYLVVDIKKYLGRSIERLDFVAVSMSDGVEVHIHYPLMSVNYEKVG